MTGDEVTRRVGSLALHLSLPAHRHRRRVGPTRRRPRRVVDHRGIPSLMATVLPPGGHALLPVALHADEVRLDRPGEHVPHGGLRGLSIPLDPRQIVPPGGGSSRRTPSGGVGRHRRAFQSEHLEQRGHRTDLVGPLGDRLQAEDRPVLDGPGVDQGQAAAGGIPPGRAGRPAVDGHMPQAGRLTQSGQPRRDGRRPRGRCGGKPGGRCRARECRRAAPGRSGAGRV